MKNLTRETKSLKFEVKEFNEDSDYFMFEGYASTFGNIDLGDDVIVKGAFIDTLKTNSNLPILWQHSMHEPIGNSVSVYEDERGLFIKARLPKADTLVNGRVIPQMKAGSIKEMSIGFFVKDYEIKGDLRYLKAIELFEVSLVTKAMNPQAQVTGFKSFKDVEFKELKDIESFLKEGGLSQNEAKTLISKVKEFSIQRDAEEKRLQRDAEEKAKIIADLQNLTNFIKQKQK